jgi:CRP/FNR family transcriptional regulator, dissimilatory nitrate respiration regulator
VAPPTDPRATFRQAALLATLRRCALFRQMPAASLAEIGAESRLRTLAKDEVLFREGETAQGFYVVHAGAVKIRRLTPDGQEQIICVFRPPESFAEVTLATFEAYPADGVALEASQVILIPRAPFRAMLRREPDLALQMLASMSLHLKHLVQSLQDLKGRAIEYRLAEWLLRQCPAAGAGCPATLTLPITKKVLAGQLGVTSETLSRTLARFKREGLITVRGPDIQFVDARGLRAYVDP